MAFDFDDSGDISREGKWVLLALGLIVACCLLTTCSYLLFKFLFKRRQLKKYQRAKELEDEKWNHRCSLQRILVLQFGDPDSKKSEVMKANLEERSSDMPVLLGLHTLIAVSNEQIREQQRINQLIQSGVTHSGALTKTMMMAINCETETVTKDNSILNSFKSMQQYLRLNHSNASHFVVSSHLTHTEPTLRESERGLSQFVANSEPTDFLLLALLDGDRHIGSPAFELQYTFHLLKALDRGATVIVVEDSHPGKDPPTAITPSSVLTAQSNKYSFSESPRLSEAKFSYITNVGGQHSKYRTGRLLRAVTAALNEMTTADSPPTYAEFVLKVQRELAREAADNSVAVQFGSTTSFAPNDTFEIIPPNNNKVQVDVISVGDVSDEESPRHKSETSTGSHRQSSSSTRGGDGDGDGDGGDVNGSVRRRKRSHRQQLPSATNSSVGSGRSVRPLRRPPPARVYQPHSDGVNPLDGAFDAAATPKHFSPHLPSSTNAARLPGRDWMIAETSAPTHILPSSPPIPARNSLPIAPLVSSSKRFHSNRSWMQS